MNKSNEVIYLEDLKAFRWELYHHRQSMERIKCLSRFYFKKYNFQHFAEEIAIAGYDLQYLNGDIRQEILLHIPNLSYEYFPSLLEKQDVLWDLNRLYVCLLYGKEMFFIKGIELIAEKRPKDLTKVITCTGFLLWQLESWLHPSIHATFYLALEKLRASPYADQAMITLIENYRNQFVSRQSKKYLNSLDVMNTILPETKYCHRNLMENFSRAECIDIIIDWDKHITTQLLHCETALYYAVEHNNLRAARKLFEKGSFIGSATNLFDSSVYSIHWKVIEKQFDNCITRCVDDERFIEIDFKNLLSPPNECYRCDGSCSDELKAIEMMADSNDHKHLLVHPLISTFVLLKWNQMAFLLHIHFILYILFILSTCGYIWCIVNNARIEIKSVLFMITLILNGYMAIRRILHQWFESCFREQNLKKQIDNCMKCIRTALVVTFVYIILLNLFERYRSVIASICIMLMASELFTLTGSLLWYFSKYYVMFLDVTKSSIKSLQLCIIIVPAFIMSFYLLLWQKSGVNNELNDAYNERRDTDYGNDDSFTFLRAAFIKVVAMSAGEFEAATSNFESNIVSGYLFVLYLFLITMVFMNLMNGLAVNDTQKIQADAETTSMIQRVRLLAHFEGIVSQKHQQLRRKYPFMILAKMFAYFAKLNPLNPRNPLNTKIYIGPRNKVLILRKDYRTSEQDSIIFDQNGTYLYSWISYFCISNQILRVDQKIVQQARRILEVKESEQREEYEKTQSKNRLLKLESDLDKIRQMTKQNQDDLNLILNKLNRRCRKPVDLEY